LTITEVVSGKARGADSLGERYASEFGIIVAKFPADWNRFGKRAGYVRNEEMAHYADKAVVFWDGISKGSRHMIDIMKKLKKPCKVVLYNQPEDEWEGEW
jgi:hypothetical protein